MRAPLRVVYIASVSYSGSTLLDLLLSSHPRIASLGEAKSFSTGRDDCTCAAGSVWRCPFWTRVGKRFTTRTAVPLREIRLDSRDDAQFVEHNRALFEAVREETGRDWLVDSSKSVDRLRRLLALDVFDLRVVHLLRSPEGVVYSNLKKRHGWAIAAYRYGRRHAAARSLLRFRDHAVVHYEQLAANPEKTLQRLMPTLGLLFDPEQLTWRDRERHNFGGNPMRLRSDRSIEPDVAWQHELGRWQRLAVPVLARIGELTP